MLKVLKPSEVKADTGKVLDAAKTEPQFIVRDGVLLVLQRVDRLPSQKTAGTSAWEALASGDGLETVFPRMTGRVRKVTT